MSWRAEERLGERRVRTFSVSISISPLSARGRRGEARYNELLLLASGLSSSLALMSAERAVCKIVAMV